MDYLEWIDYLRQRGVISLKLRQDLAHMLRHDNPSVRTQVVIFCKTMEKQHPELWITYRTTQRILRGVIR